MGKMKKKNMVNKNEFFDMLCTPGTADILRVSEKAGALTRLFPEISVMKNSAKRFYFHPEFTWGIKVNIYWKRGYIIFDA